MNEFEKLATEWTEAHPSTNYADNLDLATQFLNDRKDTPEKRAAASARRHLENKSFGIHI